MKKEKYIINRFSTKKGEEKTIISFVVSIPFMENGEKKHITKNFRISDFPTKAKAMQEATKERDRLLVSIHSDIVPVKPCKAIMVGDLFEMIPNHFSRRMNTYKQFKDIYGRYIKPKYDRVPLQNITASEINENLKSCAKKYTRASVGHLKSLWHKLYQVAQLNGIMIPDLTLAIDTPVSDNVTERSITEQNITTAQFEAYCEAMHNYGHYVDEKYIYEREIMIYLLRVMRVTGMRPQEAKAIHKSNIRYEQVAIDGKAPTEVAVIAIVSSIGSTISEELAERKPKTAKSVRDIYLFGKDIGLLKEIIAFSKYDLIFADYEGKPISSTYLSNYLYRVSNSCGIKLYAYLLRKSFASDLYASNVNPSAIKDLMGHVTASTSLQYYATTSEADKIKAILQRTYKE